MGNTRVLVEFIHSWDLALHDTDSYSDEFRFDPAFDGCQGDFWCWVLPVVFRWLDIFAWVGVI